jgi:thiol-disulfide isomerase/thioredoxin
MLSSTSLLPALDAAFDDQPAAVSEAAEPRPFDKSRNADEDVDAAIESAARRGTRALLVLGGNWCHDSRSFAAKLQTPALAALAAERFELVYVDIGRRDRNLDIPSGFGVTSLSGTPTVLIVSGTGDLLNADSIGEWTNAASRSADELLEYLTARAE